MAKQENKYFINDNVIISDEVKAMSREQLDA